MFFNSLFSPKDITECRDMIVGNSQKNNAKKEIYNLYQEFKLFINSDDENNTPDYRLYLKKRPIDIELAAVEYKDESYNLYVSNNALKQRTISNGILFHEFTHIFDREFLNRKWAISKNKKHYSIKAHVYTEIHAEQIRLLYILGCKTEKDYDITINEDTLIYNLDGKQVVFNKYLNDSRQQIIDYSEKCRNNKSKITESVMRCIIDKISYYIGALSVYKKFCSDNIDELMDLSSVSEFWEKNMYIAGYNVCTLSDILHLYCDRDIYSLNKKEISDSASLLMYTWKNNIETVYGIKVKQI